LQPRWSKPIQTRDPKPPAHTTPAIETAETNLPARPDPSLPPTAEESAPPLDGSLTQKVGKGVAWLMIQAIGTKGATNLAQIILAWMLSERDFGVWSMATTATAFASLAQQAGQREILIQRHAHFDRWANPAFWMALLMGCIGMVAMIAAAPLAALVFHHELRLIPIIMILAICAPIDALAVVPNARLQTQMRFRTIGTVGIATAVLTLILQVLFASPLCNFGVYSFVLPRPAVSLITTVAYWWAAPIKIRRNPQFRRWKYMIKDSGAIWGLAVTGAIIMYGDNLTIGIICGDKILGLYGFAYNFSYQTVQLVLSNLQSALFPALTKLAADPVRQVNAYLRAARISAVVGCFGSLLQAVLAAPMIHFVFDPKWYPAIPVFQVLSISTAINSLCGPIVSLFQAQGRFAFFFRYQLFTTALFIVAVVIGALKAEALGVAWGLLILNFLITPLTVTLAVRPGNVDFRQVLGYIIPTAGLAVLAVIPALAVSVALHAWSVKSNALTVVLGIGLSGPLCLLVLKTWQPWVWQEFTRALRGRSLQVKLVSRART